jgi:hypothetical protein
MGLGSFRDAEVELRDTLRAASLLRDRHQTGAADADDDADGSEADDDEDALSEADGGLLSGAHWLLRRALYAVDSAIASARWQLLVRRARTLARA